MADSAPRHAPAEPASGWEVVTISAEQTHPVRLAVLRSDTPTKEVRFAEDESPGAVHLGVRVDGELVATSTWVPRDAPDGTGPAVQLRGMATVGWLQGRGAGAALIAAGCAHARAIGATVVWANARDRALAFYEREGFVVVGDGFVDATTRLPHHVVVRRL
jgi:GNAT superfamily N-acetyltransferase